MKKILLGLAIVFTVALPITAALADPPTSPPGQDECDVGNSDHTCVPDPQPTNGQDCEEHGNNGGANEDHCAGTTTTTTATTASPTTTITESLSPSTTTTATPPAPTTDTTTTAPSETTATTSTTTAASTTVPATSEPSGPTGRGTGPGEKTGKLAFTGVEDIVPLSLGALGLLVLGSGLMWLGRRKA